MKQLLLTAAILICCNYSSYARVSTKLHVVVTNPTAVKRTLETVEVEWSRIIKKIPESAKSNIVVTTSAGVQVPSQFTSEGLIFQATVEPKSSTKYIITTGERESYPIQTYGRLVPERMDDWAWENNRVAFRMYGPALEATGELSNGIDIWNKRTSELIIDQWYKPGVNYHADNGQGLDNYKVGRTLGAGAMAPTDGQKFFLANNFTRAELVETGPIRTTFRLHYAPFKAVDDQVITEVRTISIDANQNFNRVTELYGGSFEHMSVVAAIVLRKEGTVKEYDQAVAYTEPADSKNGTTHVAVITPGVAKIARIQGHIAAGVGVESGKPYTYLQGTGWSKSGYPTAEDWQNEVEYQILKQNNPLKVSIK